MGSCFSKKGRRALPPAARTPEKPLSEAQLMKTKRPEETLVKKEVFIIKHRRSHELHPSGELKKLGGDFAGNGVVGAPARRPSCSKEDVDAILIQCGRLSRNSSTSRAENDERKNLALKRSFEFDDEQTKSEGSNSNVAAGDEDAAARERDNRRGLSQGRRRRTPSREREKTQSLNHRSSSIERGSSSNGGGGGRRVSRSPGRRSQSPISSRNNSNSNSLAINAKPSKPAKMVSVPATVQLDKSINADSNPTTAAKRIPVKRNVAGTASPRNRSPARARTSNENPQQQAQSLSRSNSKKAENSPFKRNPLAEIDTNIISQTPQANKQNNMRFNNNNNNEEQEMIISDPKLTRTRSSRLSRDLDIKPEVQDTKISSYTALLLEDIQNFHQKRAPPTDFVLPACVTKARSILEAVADLNSSIGSNFSTTLAEDQRREKLRKCTENRKALESNPEKIKDEIGEPVFESMIVDTDDLMPPSFEKYVTVKRGVNSGGEEIGEVESSGSNSIAGAQQQMVFSATKKEPNSAESTDRWISSSADTRRSATKSNKRTPNSKKKDSFSPHRQRARNGMTPGPYSKQVITAAASS